MFPLFSNSAYQATGGPGRSVRRLRPRLLGDLRLPLRRPGQRPGTPMSSSPTLVTAARRGRWCGWLRAAVKRPASATSSTRSTSQRGERAALLSPMATSGSARRARSTRRGSTARSPTTAQQLVHPVVISGSLDQAFEVVPVVATDGRVYVLFLNTTNLAIGCDYEVVQVSPATGAPVTGPSGSRPSSTAPPTTRSLSAGRPTRTASSAPGRRPTSPPNLPTRPTWGVVWSDIRDSATPAPSGPYTAKTNSHVIVSQSFDRGATWSAPNAAAALVRPVHAVERIRQLGTLAHRHVRPLGRSRQP
jgi:hypothetical protein